MRDFYFAEPNSAERVSWYRLMHSFGPGTAAIVELDFLRSWAVANALAVHRNAGIA
jgi:hypothetical protein